VLLEKERKIVYDAAQTLVKGGWVTGTWGNVSFCNREKKLVAITPSGLSYEDMTPEDVVIVDLEGKVVEGDLAPSSETPMHTMFYRERGDIAAVVHTHSIYATAMSALNQPIPPVIAEIALGVGGPVPVALFANIGTEELGRNAVKAMGNYLAVLLQNHGVVTVGKDMRRALNLAAIVEDAAKVYIIARSIGEPTMVPEENIQELFELFKGYGQEKK
jgi:L-ribulose-5-phosphate 4-epimerase